METGKYLSHILFKKGNRKNAGNYRPVSLTSIICNCMEQCVKDHIVNHMIRNKLFSTQQFGFIKGRSAVLQLLNVIDSWIEGNLYVVYLDFMKAFDTFPHKRLIGKLKSYVRVLHIKMDPGVLV